MGGVQIDVDRRFGGKILYPMHKAHPFLGSMPQMQERLRPGDFCHDHCAGQFYHSARMLVQGHMVSAEACQIAAIGQGCMSAFGGDFGQGTITFDFVTDLAGEGGEHVAFGYGSHVCIGQHLARMEMIALWKAILPRLKSVELAGTPRTAESEFVCGPKSVPIRFTLED